MLSLSAGQGLLCLLVGFVSVWGVLQACMQCPGCPFRSGRTTRPPDRRVQDAVGKECDVSSGRWRVADAAGRGTAEVRWPGEANPSASGWGGPGAGACCVTEHSESPAGAAGSRSEAIACSMQFGRREGRAQISPSADLTRRTMEMRNGMWEHCMQAAAPVPDAKATQ